MASAGPRPRPRNMIVCHCKAITDREVRRLQKEEGVRSPRDLARSCHAGSVCGGCLPAVRELLQSIEGGAPRRRSEDQGSAAR